MTMNSRTGLRAARLGAHIYMLGVVQSGITQGRIFQLSAYMLMLKADLRSA
jgi:hypothetical protein